MKLAIVGRGMMGSLIEDMAREHPGIEAVTAIERARGESLFDVADDAAPDVVIDFSHPDMLAEICRYISRRQDKTGIVFGTTGFSNVQLEEIQRLGELAPVIQSYNYSYGIHALKKLLACAMPMLHDRADIEIIEKHHNRKVDAPSGTALLLAGICDPAHQRNWLCGRQGEGKRQNEIGIHSLRGGTIFGEHTIHFALEDEVIEVSHAAFSKRIFAKGALEAAVWLNGKKRGIYSIEDVFY